MERVFCRLRALLERQVRLGHQACLDVLDWQNVTIAHHEIDVVERDALGLEAVVDHLLVKSRSVLLPCDPLLGNGERNLAVAKKACADVMVIRIDPENVGMAFGHENSLKEGHLTGFLMAVSC